MAITRHSTFDRNVQTITDRNNISNKVNGMTVVVADAIADINAGPGKAVYRWDSTDNSWILISKVGVDSMSFATEELIISSGKVVPSNIILDNQIWNIDIVNGSLIMAQPRIEDLTIDYTGISGLNDYNGLKLRFTYAYGTVSAQMSSIISDLETKIDAAIVGLPSKNDLDAMGIDAGTVNGHTVDTDVPVGAVFTDTVYDDTEVRQILNNKVDKVSGKGLSTEDFTTTEKNKLSSLNNYVKPSSEPISYITGLQTALDSKADITDVDNRIEAVIGAAPVALDTLGEIAAQLANDESVTSALVTTVSNKVDKVSGKGLSTEDFTTAYKTQLDNLPTQLDSKINEYDVLGSEYSTGITRAGKIVYGIEVDLGTLPNTNKKEVAFTFNSTYTYWIDASMSYSSSSTETITLPYTGYIGDDVSVKLDKTNNKIVVITSKDRTSFTNTKLVLLYTK